LAALVFDDVSAFGLSAIGLGLSTARAGNVMASAKALAAIKTDIRNEDAVMETLLAVWWRPVRPPQQ
jgi:hypothetical protein